MNQELQTVISKLDRCATFLTNRAEACFFDGRHTQSSKFRVQSGVIRSAILLLQSITKSTDPEAA